MAEQSVSYERVVNYHYFRPGDARHSQVDSGEIIRLLVYAPRHTIVEGISEAMPCYLTFSASKQAVGLKEQE